MSANNPEVQVVADSDTTVTVKVTGYYTGANTGNAKIIQANTFVGANTSRNCILEVESVRYVAHLAAGYITLEYVSTVNTNSKIYTFSGQADGRLEQLIPNNANTPSGDLNLLISTAAANDSYDLIIKLRKSRANEAFANLYNYF